MSISRSLSLSLSPTGSGQASKPLPAVEPELPPELMKYWRMLKNKVPKNAILNKMTQDKVDHSHLEEIENHLNGHPKLAQTRSASKSVSFREQPQPAEKKGEAKIEIPKGKSK